MLRVLLIRKQRNLSQSALAKKVSIELRSMCDIENGRRKPSFDVLVRIAIALECSLDELVGVDLYATGFRL